MIKRFLIAIYLVSFSVFTLSAQVSLEDYRRSTVEVDPVILGASLVVPGLALTSVDRSREATLILLARTVATGLMAYPAVDQWGDFENLWAGDLSGSELSRVKRNAALFIGGGIGNVAGWITEVLTARKTALRSAGAANYLIDVVYEGDPSQDVRSRRLVEYLNVLAAGTAPDRAEIVVRSGMEFLTRYPFEDEVPEVSVLVGRSAIEGGASGERQNALRLILRARSLFPESEYASELARTAFELAETVGAPDPGRGRLASPDEDTVDEEVLMYHHLLGLRDRWISAEDGNSRDLWRSFVVLETETFLRHFPGTEYQREVYGLLGDAYSGAPSRAGLRAAELPSN